MIICKFNSNFYKRKSSNAIINCCLCFKTFKIKSYKEFRRVNTEIGDLKPQISKILYKATVPIIFI